MGCEPDECKNLAYKNRRREVELRGATSKKDCPHYFPQFDACGITECAGLGCLEAKRQAEEPKELVYLESAERHPVLTSAQESHAIQVSQAKSLEVLSRGISDIAAFLTSGGLSQLLSGYAKSQASTAILGGLASHDGRDALDARVLGQNALEVVEQVLKVHDKFHSRLSEEGRDPEVKDAEKDFKERK
jgi:hypothetical protein